MRKRVSGRSAEDPQRPSSAGSELATSPPPTWLPVVAVVRTLRATLHGFVTLEQAGGFALPDDINASFHTAVDIVITGITDRTATRRQAIHNRGATA